MAAKKFSTRSALAFVLPSELQAPVQSIRKVHDKAYDRWPPHINFFFPFIPEEQIPSLVPRISAALADIAPFTTVLDTIGSFEHGKGPLTVWLGPSDTRPFEEIFNHLAPLFPELQNGARDVFVPHMTLGQCKRGPAFDAAAAEFKGIIGSIECVVDCVQILVRDADTPFESLYTVFLGGREPGLHLSVANRHHNVMSATEDDVLMQDSAEENASVSVLLKNTTTTGPRNFAELLGSKLDSAAVLPKEKKEKPLVHFFDDVVVPGFRSAVAVDTSGSTSGSILDWSMTAVEDAVATDGDAQNARTHILSRAISWNDSASVMSLRRMRAGGCTYPRCLLPHLHPTVRNLLITTDGEIDSGEVRKLRDALKNCNVNNVVAFIVGGRSVLDNPPHKIEMSVFFPLLEHCMERGGTFLLFFVTKEGDKGKPSKRAAPVISARPKLEARLLIKSQNERCAQFSQFVDPPAKYEKTVTWDDVPIVKLESLSSLLVEDEPTKTNDSAALAAQEHEMVVPGIEGTIDMVMVARTLSQMRGERARDLFQSVGMDQFICDVLPVLLSEGKVNTAELAAYLRDITQKWQRLNLMRIEKETEDPRLNSLLETFRELNDQRVRGEDSPDLRSRLARITDEMRPMLEVRTARRDFLSNIVRSVSSNIFESLAQISAESAPDDSSMLPEAFTLDAVTSKMANRTRRAKIVTPAKLAAAAEAQKEWNLTNAPPVCPECLVCMRDNVPGAMLAVDITKEHTNVLALNVSDAGIDDALTTGLWNTVAFPAGNFCVSCAFACAALGQHPMTRQPVAAVIPCVDLSFAENRTLMHNSLCNVFFGGKSLPSSWLVFFGALDALKREQRFPDEMIEAYKNNLLHHTHCNLFPEISPLGKTECMLDAMHRAVCLPIDRMNPETWLVTLRNRSIPSVSIMSTTVIANDPSGDSLKSATCMVRRQFFKTIVTAILNAAKRNPGNLRKMRNAIEHDIFECVAGCPVMGSQRLVSVTSANLVKILFNQRNYTNMMAGMSRIVSAFKMDSLDQLISPAAFSSFLAYIYENVTRAQISASQRKVEDFLSDCFKPRSGSASSLLSDAFFDGAVDACGGNTAALAAVLDSAPYKDSESTCRMTELCNHRAIPCFAKSHMFSPPVTHCGICGRPFLTQSEISQLKNPHLTSDHLGTVVESMKVRRNKHFAEVFGTNAENFLPTSSSSITSLHDSVRVVCSQPKFSDLKVPTRELVLAVASHVIERNNPGCPYSSTFLNSIVLCLCDFLGKRSDWISVGRVPPGECLITLRERVLQEVKADDLSGIHVISDSGLDPELLRQLTAPVAFDPVADNVAPKPMKDSD